MYRYLVDFKIFKTIVKEKYNYTTLRNHYGYPLLNCNFVKPHLHGDIFACDFLIQMDVAKLHIFNNGSHCDKSYLTAENDCPKLFLFR